MVEGKGGMYAVWSITGGKVDEDTYELNDFVVRADTLYEGENSIDHDGEMLKFRIINKGIIIDISELPNQWLEEGVWIRTGSHSDVLNVRNAGDELPNVDGMVLADQVKVNMPYVSSNEYKYQLLISWFDQAPTLGLDAFKEMLDELIEELELKQEDSFFTNNKFC